tara:strand:- start:21 stop:566 length:546 start_codon:yes stop_codon:yes gene_type:complete
MKSSPLNELNADDLKRKSIKLGKIKDQMNPEHKDYRPAAQKKLAEKLHKTQYQIDTGKRGRPTSLRNEAWLAGPSRKSALNMIGIGNITKGVKNVVDSAIDTHWAAEEKAYGDDTSELNDAYAVYDRGRRIQFGPGMGQGSEGPKGAFEFDTPRLRTKHGSENPGDDTTHSYMSWKQNRNT